MLDEYLKNVKLPCFLLRHCHNSASWMGRGLIRRGRLFKKKLTSRQGARDLLERRDYEREERGGGGGGGLIEQLQYLYKYKLMLKVIVNRT